MTLVMMLKIALNLMVMLGVPPSLSLDNQLVVLRTWQGHLYNSFFEQMVTKAMLEKIVKQTNLYAQQYMENTTLPPHSKAHGWSRATFDVAELKKFLATTITMGLISYPELEDYWSTSWPYATSAFSKVCACVYIILLSLLCTIINNYLSNNSLYDNTKMIT